MFKVPSVLSIFLHLGAIIRTGKDVEAAVQSLIKEHKIPKEIWFRIIDDLEALVNAGLVSLTEVDPKSINAMLEELKATFAYYPDPRRLESHSFAFTYPLESSDYRVLTT